MALKIIYIFFLGLLVALFVGLGVAAFYPAPKAPEYPIELSRPVAVEEGKTPVETAEQRQERINYEKASREFSEKTFPRYNRNVSIATMIAAIVILIVSLTLASSIDILSDGLLLGGVLTLLYSVIRGFMGQEPMYRFLVVTVGLLIALILGYVKFIRQPKSSHH